MVSPSFWSDKKESENVLSKINRLKSEVNQISTLKKRIEDHIETLALLKEEYVDEMKIWIEEEYEDIHNQVIEVQTLLLLHGPYDTHDAIIEIHSGAGGTESCDWAFMLARMYQRYAEKKGYKVEKISELPGEEVGYKSISMIVHGEYSYGYLKNEKGVHRLIRLSPFDSGNRRHTSFASVEVIPVFENEDIDIDILESDLRIDVYRSSGHGGQGVNTTDSAVRITHLPTKIVVTCQNERSQIKNKETAMNVLKSKLYELELEKREASLKAIKGSHMETSFGSQIRSYVMHPYSMVKDHRTLLENSNVEKVLDGELEEFIEANLKRG